MNTSNNKKIKIFVTLEQRLYRDAVLFELVNEKDIDLVGESSSGNDTLKLLATSQPSTLIIEENLKDIDGLTIAELALSKNPALTIILVVDSIINQSRLAIYLDAGIKSVVSKKQSIHDLRAAVNYTRNGQIFVDVERFNILQQPQNMLRRPIEGFDYVQFYSLSEREQEVAYYIADHMPLNNIAERLGVSSKTIHTYKDRIFVKLGFQKLPELIVYMKRLNFCLELESQQA